MLKPLNKEATEDTPKVCLDKEQNLFEISGRSLPENATKYYESLIEWFEQYIEDPNPETHLNLKLEYYNSASIKEIVKMLVKLEELHNDEHQVKITWYYHKEDELMEARGKEMQTLLQVPFELKTYE